MAQLETYLQALGVKDEEGLAQLARLRVGDFALTPEPLGSLGDTGFLRFESQVSAGDGASVLEPLFLPDVEAVVESDEEMKSADLAAISAEHAEEEATPPSGFVISLTHGGRCRRLHYTGFCFRIPGGHLLKFELCGEQEPVGHLYDLRCKDCFPAQSLKATREELEEIVSDGSDGSSSDSAQPEEEGESL